MIMAKYVSKTNLYSICFYAIFIATIITLKHFNLFGIMSIVGVVIALGIVVFDILNFSKYSFPATNFSRKILMFCFSEYAKIMVFLTFLLTKSKYPGGDVVFMIATYAYLIYIIICLCKKSWGEAITALVFRETMCVLCIFDFLPLFS